MVNLPPGFDFSVLISDLFFLATPYIALTGIVVAGLLILKILRRV